MWNSNTRPHYKLPVVENQMNDGDSKCLRGKESSVDSSGLGWAPGESVQVRRKKSTQR